MKDMEKIRVIAYRWQEEARDYKEAGRIARESVETELRVAAIAQRAEHLAKCDQLLDAYIELRCDGAA